VGAEGYTNVEFPWGLHNTLFEVGLGTAWSVGGYHFGPEGAVSGGTGLAITIFPPLNYYFLDTYACPVDVPFLDRWLSVLACGRVAGAYFSGGVSAKGGALWFGTQARLRVQAPFGLFAELGLGANYGTISGGESTDPGWIEASASAGLRL
jgi:hypothetical protein